jgi:hypothetical protein
MAGSDCQNVARELANTVKGPKVLINPVNTQNALAGILSAIAWFRQLTRQALRTPLPGHLLQ